MEPISQNFFGGDFTLLQFFTGNASTRLDQNLFFATFYKILANFRTNFLVSFQAIVIATPGRFVHLCVEMGLRLTGIEYVVFDEADR